MATSETIYRELFVRLTDPELLERGDEMAKAELAIKEGEAERKAVNDRLAELTKKRRKLAEVIDAGQENREVACQWEDDFEHNAKRLRRLDTGDEVDTVAMTAEDRQVAMGLDQKDDGEYREDAEDSGKPEFPPDHLEGARLNS